MSSDDRLSGRKTLKVSGILDEFEKDRIKADIDIVSLFESFGVSLTKKGKNYKGRCPWHEDSTPSLSVDKDKGLYNCFGCGESGDAFSLVEKIKGLDFKNALEYLKNNKTSHGIAQEIISIPALKPVEKIVKIEAIDPVDSEAIHLASEVVSITFEDIIHHWIKRLHHNESAQKYLEGRGLSNKQNHDFFSVGYSDGSLVEKLSETQKKKLIEIGILNDKGREVFDGFVTVPLFDNDHRIRGIYGRSISDASTSSATKKSVKHLYLKGPLHGLINRRSFPIYRDRMILAESIIDAMSLYELGIKNVTACYGTNGFKDEHLKALKENMVKEVVIAFDADEAGRKASSELKERLVVEGFSVKVIEPIIGNGSTGILVKDWNEYLITGMTKNDFEALIDSASSSVPEESNSFKVKKESGVYEFVFSHVTYRVTGVKDVFVQDLRINIKATSGNEFFYDKVDLYSSRSRTSYSSSLSSLFDIEYKRIEKDLVSMLEYLEAERDKALRPQTEEEPLSEEDRALGLEFLTSPNLFEWIASDMELLGYVGEELNKNLIYLAASSRFLDDPLSVLVISQSASGKSLLADTVKKMIPPNDVIALTSLSDQALNYIPSLEHKFMVMGEAVHNEIIEHQIREMLSGKELSRLVTMKNLKTGELESKLVRTPAVVSCVMSSTRQSINPENASRFFVINADESRDQTRRIHQAQRNKYSLSRFDQKEKLIPQIIRKHQAAQRLLKKIMIINPFARFLDFPDILMRSRRDNDRFMDLIACVCFLRQYQKEIQTDGGREYISCDLEDYRIAFEIMMGGVLSATMTELPKSAVSLYDKLLEFTRTSSNEEKLLVTEISFTQREVREKTGFGQTWLKINLKLLVDYEYILLVSGGQQRSKGVYRIKENTSISEFGLSMIPTPDEMKIKFQTGHSGKNWS